MSSLLQRISEQLATAFTTCDLPAHFSQAIPSDRPDLCQFQCNGALGASKYARENPRVIAEKVVAALDQSIFSKVEIAGPGFINLTLKDEVILETNALLLADPRLGIQKLPSRKTIIDFGGPNVAKPLHVGHLRSSVIGDSLQRLYRFLGQEVYGDIHLGDWGTPMGILIEMVKREGLTNPTLVDLERLYPAGSALLKEDPEFQKAAQQATAELQNGNPAYRQLWEQFITVSVAALKQDFARLGVSFDWWYGESHYHNRIAPLVERLIQRGQAIESEGALIIPVGEELPPLILVKSDGAYLYSTTDLAAIEERVNQDQAERILYVVDQRQSLHFKQVFAAARQTDLAPETVELQHLGFGTVNGPDGKPFKTRTGGVMKLQDLISLSIEKAREKMQEVGLAKDYPTQEQEEIAQKVGIAALKFADLVNNRLSDYSFDTERFVSFEGKTGPYLTYTAVRIKSIFRKLGLPEQPKLTALTAADRPLVLLLAQLPEVIETAYLQNSPHFLADFAFTLAQEFNRFYQNCNIQHEEDLQRKVGWLALCQLSLSELELLLQLLGIEIPERM